MICPPQEWPATIMGPSCRANTSRNRAASSAMDAAKTAPRSPCDPRPASARSRHSNWSRPPGLRAPARHSAKQSYPAGPLYAGTPTNLHSRSDSSDGPVPLHIFPTRSPHALHLFCARHGLSTQCEAIAASASPPVWFGDHPTHPTSRLLCFLNEHSWAVDFPVF
jgi:hypothetical protein